MALEFQKEIIIFLQDLQSGFSEFFFNFISFLGEPEFYILLLGFIYWVLSKKAGEAIGVTLGLSLSINNLLKAVFQFERPYLTHDEIENLRPGTSTGSSFPSGHTQGAASVFFAVALAFKKRFLWIIAIVLSVLMMLSRMFLGVHYLQDVLAGALIGFLIAIGIHKIIQAYYHRPMVLHKIYGLMIALMLPAVLFVDSNDFFRGYGVFVGLILAVVIEKRYVNFSIDITWARKILRYVLGVVLLAFTMSVLGWVFAFAPENLKNALDFVRFFLVALIGFGLYPMFFTKYDF